uniref:4'-phosphopantetheinyl transferase family protein n=1 Tax=Alistipes putredinis TaxID=28117 RepID=UPI003FD71AAF
RAAAHFLTPAEAALGDDPHVAGVVWCAKETLYKYSGRRNLDLLRDLRIERFDPDEGRMTGRICGESALEIGLRREEELLAAYILV